MADSANVRVGTAGKLWYSPTLGVTFPTNPYTAWDSDDFTEIGLIDKATGLMEAVNQDSTDIEAWGYDGPARVIMSNKITTFKFTVIETNKDVLSLFYDVPLDDMTATAASGSNAKFISFQEGQAVAPTEFALGIDIIDLGVRDRFNVARSIVSERGDVTYNKSGAISFELTCKALLDSDGYSIYRMYGGLALT